MSNNTFSIKDTAYSKENAARNETLFTVANGYLGMRGDFEEQTGCTHKGTYINGFFDSEPIIYGETAYGYAKNHETMLNLPDPKFICVKVNGEFFSINMEDKGDDAFCMELNLKTGVMLRRVRAKTSDGTCFTVTAERFASFVRLSCAVIRYSVQITSVGKGVKNVHVEIVSGIDTTVTNISAEEDPRVGAKFSSRPLIITECVNDACSASVSFSAKTHNSGLSLAGIAVHELYVNGAQKKNAFSSAGNNDIPSLKYECELAAGEKIELVKYISYNVGDKNGFDHGLKNTASECAHDIARAGYDEALKEQTAYLDSFWNIAAVHIEGSSDDERAVHFNLFQLLQSAGKDGKTSIAAKGLTGEGYEGHYFWDTESYVCPVFTYLKPEVADSLLQYRYSVIDKARDRAAELGLKGALFPWRTISGHETSAYFPAGTAQYHIDADIVFALNRLLHATGQCDIGSCDKNIVSEKENRAAVIACETARMWMSLGSFVQEKGGAFCINCVTGPDEYTACVNNNAYTNLMARENLRIAVRLGKQFNAASEEELALWSKAADKMYIPFDQNCGIYPQDDSFMAKESWDFANTPKENYPLLLHYHPLTIYRKRVLKQPDLVLAQTLLTGLFTKAEKIRNFNFYEPYTTGDSSLSHCIQCIAACESGDTGKASMYFNKTARMDIEDKHGNTRDGIHIACMAGSWMALMYGFVGFRDYGADWSFNPVLPDGWNGLECRLLIRNSLLNIKIDTEGVTYSLVKSDGPFTFRHRNKKICLEEGESYTGILKQKLEAVLFDLDGVITDTAELHYKAWKAVADKYGLKFDREMNKFLTGRSRMDSLEIMLEKNSAVWSSEQKKSVAFEKNELYKQYLETIDSSCLLPGIADLLEELNQHSVACVLASASLNAPSILKKLGIEKYFKDIVNPADLQKGKPEPDIYLKAAELSGAWYTNCVGIEDAPSGINAIKTAGIKAVGVGQSLQGADCLVSGTAELNYSLLVSIF